MNIYQFVCEREKIDLSYFTDPDVLQSFILIHGSALLSDVASPQPRDLLSVLFVR